jgi:hypothetical protein
VSYIEKRFDTDGSIIYEVGTLYQDGYDRSRFRGPDAEVEAIKSYHAGQWVLGGMKSDRTDGPAPQIRDKTRWPEVTTNDRGGLEFDRTAFDDAAKLAMRQQRLAPGRRYELRVVFEAIEDTFLGGGI